MKRYVAVLLAAALFLGAGAGISYAYLTDEDEVVNHFSAVDTEIEIEENFEPPGEILPGSVIKKAPSVTNTSDAPCYVRVSVRFTDSAMQKLCEPLTIKSRWQQGPDGWYYWPDPLEKGERTPPLFEEIRIREDVNETWCPFDVLLYAEAVGSEGRSMSEAWEFIEK